MPESADGDVQMQVSRMLPFLQRVYVYTSRVNDVVKNVVQQLGALYAARPPKQSIVAKDVHLLVSGRIASIASCLTGFQTLFSALGDMFAVLITMDELLLQNNILTEHWALYKRSAVT